MKTVKMKVAISPKQSTEMPMGAAKDITEKVINKALCDFISQFSTPTLPADHILYGQQSGQSLPSDTNDFCVFVPIAQTRSGTNNVQWSEGKDTAIIREYVNIVYQIDFYSNDITRAEMRAQTIETLARSYVGANFFRARKIDCLYAENVRNLTALLDDSSFTSRWSLEIRLGYNKLVEVSQDYFTEVKPNLINIDATFKP